MMHFCIMLTPQRIYEVIDQRRRELGLSQVEVSLRAFGRADNGPLQSIRRGSWPSVEKLAALAAVLGLEFSFGGLEKDDRPETHVILDSEDFAAIPLLGAHASAGPGVDNGVHGDIEVVELLAFRQQWLTSLGIAVRNACLLRVRGDSMAPRLEPGDLALIDKGRNTVRSGHVYAVNDINGETRIKRIDQPDPGLLILRSDNPDHLAEARRGHELNRLTIVGEVIWSGHTWPR
jgi:phage repressor protein C with HTH and peptisase S24 domain